MFAQTVLSEEQAKKRAGLTPDGHNHGEDWGDAGTLKLKPQIQFVLLTCVAFV